MGEGMGGFLFLQQIKNVSVYFTLTFMQHK